MLTYKRFGDGKTALLAFHGIGQDASVYQKWGEFFTVFAFELPFHGENPHIPEVFSLDELEEYLTDFLVKNQIKSFLVAGFSLGGRFALAAYQFFPERCEALYLVGPDGLEVHPVYRLATSTALGRWMLRTIVLKTNFLIGASNFLEKTKIIPPAMARFTRWMLATPQKRQQLVASWICFRKLRFNMLFIVKKIEQNSTRTFLLMGQFDVMMPPHKARLMTRYTNDVKVVVFPCGHTTLLDTTAEWLRKTKR